MGSRLCAGEEQEEVEAGPGGRKAAWREGMTTSARPRAVATGAFSQSRELFCLRKSPYSCTFEPLPSSPSPLALSEHGVHTSSSSWTASTVSSAMPSKLSTWQLLRVAGLRYPANHFGPTRRSRVPLYRAYLMTRMMAGNQQCHWQHVAARDVPRLCNTIEVSCLSIWPPSGDF